MRSQAGEQHQPAQQGAGDRNAGQPLAPQPRHFRIGIGRAPRQDRADQAAEIALVDRGAEIVERLIAYVRAGGKIVAVGSTPSLAPGYLDAARISARLVAASGVLFALPNVRMVADDAGVGAALRALLAPDLAVSAQAADIGFVRRR